MCAFCNKKQKKENPNATAECICYAYIGIMEFVISHLRNEQLEGKNHCNSVTQFLFVCLVGFFFSLSQYLMSVGMICFSSIISVTYSSVCRQMKKSRYGMHVAIGLFLKLIRLNEKENETTEEEKKKIHV